MTIIPAERGLKTADEVRAYANTIKEWIKSKEQEKKAQEQTENSIKAQIAALEELRAEEANPAKRAAYTSEIESLKKRLE